MDSKQFIDCIGKQETSAEVQSLLASVGVSKKLKVPKGDIEARVDLPSLGLSLVFMPENEKSSVLVFYGVQFCSDKEGGYTSFAGSLPSQLSFSDTRDTALAKLGEPEEAMPDLRRDIWLVQELQLSLEYTEDNPPQIGMVTVEVPYEG